jgi:dethiobiotin synthetase
MKDLPKAVFITGTDTGVGKTVVTAALAALLWEKRSSGRGNKAVSDGNGT